MEAVLTALAPLMVAVRDSSHVSSARQGVNRMTQALGFDETRAGRAAIIATEAATNILKHAGRGTFLARAVGAGEALGVEMLAIDQGPGMRDFEASAVDGHSTAGSAGTGLGAIRRQSDEFEIYTRVGEGSILRCVVWLGAAPAAGAYEVGALCVPKPGETVCGDAWGVEFDAHGATFMLADGLGHGPDASRASSLAVDTLQRHAGDTAIRLLDRVHAKLKPTRGAAVAVMRDDRRLAEVSFAGVGNISAAILDRSSPRRAMVSHNGIVGANMHKSQEYRYPWQRGALLVAHTDGIDTHWDLGAHPGLADCHPSVIAAMLYREHCRGRDDAGVVVARARA